MAHQTEDSLYQFISCRRELVRVHHRVLQAHGGPDGRPSRFTRIEKGSVAKVQPGSQSSLP